ncbi:MAG: hypothetical protein ABJI96_16890 [Paracoccaceae bacterium]
MSSSLKRSLSFLFTLSLLVFWAAASAHFLLNLNVRVFRIEHTNEGLRVYARMLMQYLVADKIGDPGEDGLPTPAPFTTNAIENDAIVHYLDKSRFTDNPLGLGVIAEAGIHLAIDGQTFEEVVKNVVLHRVDNEAGFTTSTSHSCAAQHRPKRAFSTPSPQLR